MHKHDRDAKRVVILVHGIRTFGAWQNRLRHLLRSADPDIVVYRYFYGYFSGLMFAIPFLRVYSRWRLRKWIEMRRLDLSDCELSIVAHSYGTHIVTYLLKSLSGTSGISSSSTNERIAFKHVIFCGSVVRDAFDWDDIVGVGKLVSTLVNDCGSRDVWPIISQAFIINTGVAGRYGFRGVLGGDTGVYNRYHKDVDHSGFFSDEFMVTNWLPVILRSEIGESELDTPTTPSAIVGLVMIAEPIKLALLLLPVIVAASLILWEQQRRSQAEHDRAQAEYERYVEEGFRILSNASDVVDSDPVGALILLESRTWPEFQDFARQKLKADSVSRILRLVDKPRFGYSEQDGQLRSYEWSNNLTLLSLRSSAPKSSAVETETSSLRIVNVADRSTFTIPIDPDYISGFAENVDALFIQSHSGVSVYNKAGKEIWKDKVICDGRMQRITKLFIFGYFEQFFFLDSAGATCQVIVNQTEQWRPGYVDGAESVAKIVFTDEALGLMMAASGNIYSLKKEQNGVLTKPVLRDIGRKVVDVTAVGSFAVALTHADRSDAKRNATCIGDRSIYISVWRPRDDHPRVTFPACISGANSAWVMSSNIADGFVVFSFDKDKDSDPLISMHVFSYDGRTYWRNHVTIWPLSTLGFLSQGNVRRHLRDGSPIWEE